MNPLDYLAIYGAVLSTIAIGWNIHNNLQDKPKIEVKTKFGFMSNDIEKTFLFITIINKGKRSIHLNSFGLRTGKDNLLPNRVTALPCELKPGKSHDEFFDVSKLKNRQFDFAWYKDEVEKLYKSKSIRKKLDTYFEHKPKKKKRGLK